MGSNNNNNNDNNNNNNAIYIYIAPFPAMPSGALQGMLKILQILFIDYIK